MAGSKLDLKKKRIRAFFLSIEVKKKKKRQVDKKAEELYRDGMVYIQMRLPVEKITKEFEDKLKNKIEHTIIHAAIRESKSSDLNSIKNIYNKSWLTSNTPFRPITKTSLLQIFEDPDTVFLIGKVYGIDAAFAILNFEGENKEFAVIAALAVLPRFQRKGLGTILGMATWNFIKENYEHVKELKCEVYKDNVISNSFIKWIGFEECGTKAYKKEDFQIESNV
ncbi:MAG: GNAT family N-acetyltransferase [Promethearchaeota archaeon]